MKSWFSLQKFSREGRTAALVLIFILGAATANRAGHTESAVFLAGCAIAVAAAFYFLVFKPSRIPDDAVLEIKLHGAMREEPRRSLVDQLMGRGFPALSHIRYSLTAAVTDPRLRAVVVEISGFENGLATAEELHDLIRLVRDSGKRVIAILQGDLVSTRECLIATAASEVLCNPDTMIAMLGAAAGNIFVKRALERLDIGVQTLQWKEYKGAAEMLSRDAMSAALRESIEAIVSDWRQTLTTRISESRKIPRERAHELVAAGFVDASYAIKAGLVDREGYVEDVRRELEPDPKTERFVSLARYLRHAAYVRERGERPRLALVCASGPVISGEGPGAGEFISGGAVAAQIEAAARDESVRAILFRVNSPGGSAVGSDLVWRAVKDARERGKPVVVSMGDVAGSGGYYIAMGADAIVAEPSTLTGSIGVVYAKFDVSGLLGRLGVSIDTVKSDPSSDALSVMRPMTDAELSQLNEVIGRIYNSFTSKVAQGRKLDAEAAERVAKGRVWTGKAARECKLVDELGGLGRAIEIAREKAGIALNIPIEIRSYSQPRFVSALRLSLASAEPTAALNIGARAMGLPSRWMPAMAQLLIRGGLILFAPTIEL